MINPIYNRINNFVNDIANTYWYMKTTCNFIHIQNKKKMFDMIIIDFKCREHYWKYAVITIKIQPNFEMHF